MKPRARWLPTLSVALFACAFLWAMLAKAVPLIILICWRMQHP